MSAARWRTFVTGTGASLMLWGLVSVAAAHTSRPTPADLTHGRAHIATTAMGRMTDVGQLSESPGTDVLQDLLADCIDVALSSSPVLTIPPQADLDASDDQLARVVWKKIKIVKRKHVRDGRDDHGKKKAKQKKKKKKKKASPHRPGKTKGKDKGDDHDDDHDDDKGDDGRPI